MILLDIYLIPIGLNNSVMNKRDVYLWDVLERSSQKLVGEYLKENIQDRLIYKQGLEIKENIITPTVVFNDSTNIELKKFSCLESNMMVPIIDDKISTVLSELAPHQIQLMDVIIKTKDRDVPRQLTCPVGVN